jgi:hypothetical protein
VMERLIIFSEKNIGLEEIKKYANPLSN